MKFEITLHDALHLGAVDLRLGRYFFIGLTSTSERPTVSCSNDSFRD